VPDIRCTVNGTECTAHAPPMARLLDVLREELRLTGVKEGCGEGECGACSVLLNGELVNSCLVPVLQAEGASITTIEGVASAAADAASKRRDSNGARSTGEASIDTHLHAIQQAFLEQGGAQCGICTPGMILATISLLERHPQPTEEQIREGLAGNLCRCTGYGRIFAAVRQAVQRR
jgi:carbon-monoxide dehydrogenase small subunit